MTLRQRFTNGSGFIVSALVFLGACASDSVPTPSGDGGAERDSIASAEAAGDTSDVARDAPLGSTDASHVDVDSGPCVADPDATVTCPPEDLPPDDNCPDAAPSYTTEVAAIIARKCTVCHRVGGLEPVNQFDTLAKILKNNNNIHMLTQVYSCRMPQGCGEPLTPEEKQKLLQWLVCGAPNN